MMTALALLVSEASDASACSRLGTPSLAGKDWVLPTPGSTAPRDAQVWLVDHVDTRTAADAGSGDAEATRLPRDGGAAYDSWYFCDAPEVAVDGIAARYEVRETRVVGEQPARLRAVSFAAPLPVGAEVVVRCGRSVLTTFRVGDALAETPRQPVIGRATTETAYSGCYSCGNPASAELPAESNGALSIAVRPGTLWPARNDTPWPSEVLGVSTSQSLTLVSDRAGPKQVSVVALSLAGAPSASIDAEYTIDEGESGCNATGIAFGGAGPAVLTVLGLALRRLRARRRD
jgi:hypothetical protein